RGAAPAATTDGGRSVVLKRLSSGEPRVHFVPPPQRQGLASPPAQIDNAAVAFARKIDQPGPYVAHDDTHALDALEEALHLAGGGAAGGFGRLASDLSVHLAIGADLPLIVAGGALRARQSFGQRLKLAKQTIDLGQECLGLLARERA